MNGTYSIGVDLGGTNLRIAAYTSGIEFLEVAQIPTRLAEGREAVVRDMCEAIQALRKKAFGLHFAGIGIGSPGPLELPRGILHDPPNLIGWDGFDLRQAIERELGCSIALENDANLAALAEQRLGSGQMYDVNDLCVITLGTGVGSGFILGGRIWHGFSGMGGEAGHAIMVDADGPTCPCGSSGCLELYASATGILRMACEDMGGDAPETCAALAGRAEKNDARAKRIFDRTGRALGIALAGLINTLNLPLYLIAGGVSDAWPLFAPAMFEEVEKRSFVYRATAPHDRGTAGSMTAASPTKETHIMRARLGATAGLLGACILPLLQDELQSHLSNEETRDHSEVSARFTSAWQSQAIKAQKSDE